MKSISRKRAEELGVVRRRRSQQKTVVEKAAAGDKARAMLELAAREIGDSRAFQAAILERLSKVIEADGRIKNWKELEVEAVERTEDGRVRKWRIRKVAS